MEGFIYKTLLADQVVALESKLRTVLFSIIKNDDKEAFNIDANTGFMYYRNIGKQKTANNATINTRKQAADFVQTANQKIGEAISREILPSSFPALFPLDNLVALTESTDEDSDSYEVSYGIQLRTLPHQQSKAPLEHRSITLKFTSGRLVSMDYAMLPIVRSIKTTFYDEALNESLPVIYKQIGASGLISSYFISTAGVLPLCKESVISKLDLADGSVAQSRFNENYESDYLDFFERENNIKLVTLTKVIDPKTNNHGIAEYLISGEFRIVTEGVGSDINPKFIKVDEIKKCFEKGKIGILDNVNVDDIKSGYESINLLLKVKEGDWNYYKLVVNYKMSIKLDMDINIWDLIIWNLNKSSKKVIICSPIYEDLLIENIEFFNASNRQKRRIIKRLFPNETVEEKNFQKFDDLTSLKFTAKIISIFLYYYLKQDTEQYEGKSLIFPVKVIEYLEEYTDAAFSNFLSEYNIAIVNKDANLEDNYVNFNTGIMLHMFNSLYFFAKSMRGTIQSFSQSTSLKGKPARAIVNGKYIFLNPHFFSKKNNTIYDNLIVDYWDSKKKYPSESELIVHEIGHTLCTEFFHDNESYSYSYSDVGLSSNEGGKVYPTISNTLMIIYKTYIER